MTDFSYYDEAYRKANNKQLSSFKSSAWFQVWFSFFLVSLITIRRCSEPSKIFLSHLKLWFIHWLIALLVITELLIEKSTPSINNLIIKFDLLSSLFHPVFTFRMNEHSMGVWRTKRNVELFAQFNVEVTFAKDTTRAWSAHEIELFSAPKATSDSSSSFNRPAFYNLQQVKVNFGLANVWQKA